MNFSATGQWRNNKNCRRTKQNAAGGCSPSVSVTRNAARSINTGSTAPFRRTACRRPWAFVGHRGTSLTAASSFLWSSPALPPIAQPNSNFSTCSIFPDKDAPKAKSLQGMNTKVVPPKPQRCHLLQEHMDGVWVMGRQAEGKKTPVSYEGACRSGKHKWDSQSKTSVSTRRAPISKKPLPILFFPPPPDSLLPTVIHNSQATNL